MYVKQITNIFSLKTNVVTFNSIPLQFSRCITQFFLLNTVRYFLHFTRFRKKLIYNQVSGKLMKSIISNANKSYKTEKPNSNIFLSGFLVCPANECIYCIYNSHSESFVRRQKCYVSLVNQYIQLSYDSKIQRHMVWAFCR